MVFPYSKISFISVVRLMLNSEAKTVNKTSGIWVLAQDSLSVCASQNQSSKSKSTIRRTFLICSTAALTQYNERSLLIASFTLTYEEYTIWDSYTLISRTEYYSQILPPKRLSTCCSLYLFLDYHHWSCHGHLILTCYCFYWEY